MYYPNEIYNRRAKSMLQEELDDDVGLQLGDYRPKRRDPAAQRARKWVVVGATLAVMLASAVTSGETRSTPCEQAYQVSGLTEQQMSFAEFRKVYSAGICAPGGE